MASYLDKVQLNTPVTDNTKMDFSHQQITTTDIMQLNVSYIHEMMPGERISVNMESFARLNPMPVPTFGRMSMRHRAFFVPMRTIFPKFADFITDTPHINADGYTGAPVIPNTVPLVTNKTLAEAFLNNSGTDADSDPNAMVYPTPTGTTPDITSTGTSSTWIGKYNFTTTGRVAIKMLEALGYKINWVETDTTSFSALPLIALAKIYSDYYWPQQYSNLDLYDRISYISKWDASTDYVMSDIDVWYILKICAWVCFDSDYFVSAWDIPNQPNAGNYSSDFKLVNLDTVSDYTYKPTTSSYGGAGGIDAGFVTNNSGSVSVSGPNIKVDAPFINPVIAAIDSQNTVRNFPVPISQYLLHSLHALSDYLKRNQLAGSQAYSRFLAQYGQALPAEKLNRSNYLGAHMQDIQIGDIMSTSDTEGANLGKFAGKGMTYGNGAFEYSTNEFGYFIILTSIVPNTGYFQGIDRQVKRITKLQFANATFDALGTQPITADELFVPQDGTVMTGNLHEQVFGFTPRYADYKVAHDQLLGNFRLNSINAGNDVVNAADSWHLMRVFNAASFSGNYANVVHSPNFIYGWNNAKQWKRLFYYQEADAPDNFTVIHNFDIAAWLPLKGLYDNYEFEDKGKKVTMDANGVKMN